MSPAVSNNVSTVLGLVSSLFHLKRFLAGPRRNFGKISETLHLVIRSRGNSIVLKGFRISLRWPIYFINPVDKTKL